MKKLCIAATAVAGLLVAAAPAAAHHAWGDYHWERTMNPFGVSLGDNTTGAWRTGPTGTYLAAAAGKWSASSVLNANVVDGSAGKRCKATSGRVEVCTDRYGANGWLGLTSIWLSGSHIVQATVKLNDTHFNGSFYGTDRWRESVMCHEVGHTFGLDHPSVDSNVNTGSCMDYWKDANTNPNDHDFAVLEEIYAHLDDAAPPPAPTKPGNGKGGGKGNGNGKGLRKLSDSLYVEDLGGERKRLVWVTWTQPQIPHGPPAGS